MTLSQNRQNQAGDPSGWSLLVGFRRSRSRSGLFIPAKVLQEQEDAERKAEREDLDYGTGNRSVQSAPKDSASLKSREAAEQPVPQNKDSAVTALSVFRKAHARDVPVFGQPALENMRVALTAREKNKSDNAMIIAPLKAAIENNGVRAVPKFSVKKVFAGLDDEFPNFVGVIGTSNYLDQVDPVLRSRLSVHRISEPDTAQRLAVMQRVCRETARSARKKIGMDMGAALTLAEAHEYDLRVLIAAVRRGVGNALVASSNVAVPALHGVHDKPKGRGIGFMAKL